MHGGARCSRVLVDVVYKQGLSPDRLKSRGLSGVLVRCGSQEIIDVERASKFATSIHLRQQSCVACILVWSGAQGQGWLSVVLVRLQVRCKQCGCFNTYASCILSSWVNGHSNHMQLCCPTHLGFWQEHDYSGISI